MDKDLILYDEESLDEFEITFMDMFKNTHSLSGGMELLNTKEKKLVKQRLRDGTSNLGKVYAKFVNSAPVHPEANKVVILDNLIWVMNQAKIDQDTNGVIRAISEINKMIKGNLTTSQETKINKTTLVALVDMTKKSSDEEPITIEI